MDNAQYHSLEHVSIKTGIALSTIRGAARAGKLSSVKVGHQTMVSDSAVTKWLSDLEKEQKRKEAEGGK